MKGCTESPCRKTVSRSVQDLGQHLTPQCPRMSIMANDLVKVPIPLSVETYILSYDH